MELRTLPDDFRHKIRTNGGMTLILITEFGDMSFENSSPVKKDALIADYNEDGGDTLLLAWTGQYKTDIFLLTQEDLNKHYREK